MKKVKHNYLEESNEVLEKNLDVHYIDQTFDLSKLSYYEFNGCFFENCTFINEGSNMHFCHCIFNNCDLCNTTFNKTKLYITEIKESKLIGITLNESIFENTIIKESNLKFSSFYYHKFKDVLLEDSILNESILEGTTLIKTKINNSNLTKIDIIKTKFNIDLSTNNIEEIKITLEDIKDATISYSQCSDLIKLLQVKIK